VANTGRKQNVAVSTAANGATVSPTAKPLPHSHSVRSSDTHVIGYFLSFPQHPYIFLSLAKDRHGNGPWTKLYCFEGIGYQMISFQERIIGFSVGCDNDGERFLTPRNTLSTLYQERPQLVVVKVRSNWVGKSINSQCNYCTRLTWGSN
jgi:hypothetical protein